MPPDPNIGRRRRTPPRVLDPLTAERILVGGERFDFLTGTQSLDRPPFFVYENRELRLNPAIRRMAVPLVKNPSPPPRYLRRTREWMPAPLDASLAFLRLYLGDLTEGEAREEFAASLDAWYATEGVRVALGPYTYDFEVIDEDDPEGYGAGLGDDYMGPLVDYTQAIAADDPLLLPFTNYELNPGDDERCVDRWLGWDLSSRPWCRVGAQAISKAAREAGIPHRLVDLLGGVIAEWVPSNAGEPRCALIYNGHLYPLHGSTPKLIRGPELTYEVWQNEVRPLVESNHSIFYRRDDTFFVAGEGGGVMRPKSEVYEPWMGRLMEALPMTRGWDPNAMRVVKESAVALRYTHPSVSESDNPNIYLSVDVTKCYFNALRKTLADNVEVGDATMWDVWVRVDERREGVRYIPDHAYVEVEEDLSSWGIGTSVIQGRLLKLLCDNQVHVTVRRVLEFRFSDPFLNDVQQRCKGVTRTSLINRARGARKRALEVLDELTPEQQKAYATVNGMMGIYRVSTSLWFQVDPERPHERDYYLRKYPGMSNVGATLVYTEDRGGFINRLHWHAHVVHYASFLVLKQAFAVRRATKAVPLRIVTDSLMYRRSDWFTPFDRVDGEGRLLSFFANDDGNTWHTEAHARVNVVRQAFRRITVEPEEPLTYDNVTYTGPPGVGKTYRALHDESMPIDEALCFSNMGARRLGRDFPGAKTIHAGLGVWSQDKRRDFLERVRGKRILVDEAQACGTALWGFFREAYHRVNARFVFAMDPDQVRPVGEERWKFDMTHPFLGRVERLTVERRNEPELVAFRQTVLTHPYRKHPMWLLHRGFPHVEMDRDTFLENNISMFHSTAEWVGAQVARYLGHTWHVSGLYRVEEATRFSYLRLFKQQRLECLGPIGLGDTAMYRDRDDPTMTYQLTKAQAKKHLRWGYCATVHSMVGETVPAPAKLGVWDWVHYETPLAYTAVTRVQSMDQLRFMCGRPGAPALPPHLDPLVQAFPVPRHRLPPLHPSSSPPASGPSRSEE